MATSTRTAINDIRVMSSVFVADNVIYGVVVWLAALSGVVVALFVLLIVAWGGTDIIGADVAAVLGVVSAVLLLVGAIASTSNRLIHPLATILGATFFPVVVALSFDRPSSGFKQFAALPWPYIAIVMIDFCAIVLSAAKLTQLRKASR